MNRANDACFNKAERPAPASIADDDVSVTCVMLWPTLVFYVRLYRGVGQYA